jgi:hypothetical protein
MSRALTVGRVQQFKSQSKSDCAGRGFRASSGLTAFASAVSLSLFRRSKRLATAVVPLFLCCDYRKHRGVGVVGIDIVGVDRDRFVVVFDNITAEVDGDHESV